MAPAFTITIAPSRATPWLSTSSDTSVCVPVRHNATVSMKRHAYHFDFDIAHQPAIPRPLGAAGGTALLWLRGVDLRIHDATALVAACTQHASVAPVFVLRGVEDTATLHSLRALRSQFRTLGGDLYIRRGSSELVLASLASRVRARVIHTTRGIKCDESASVRRVEASLRERDIALVQHWDGFVRSPDTLPFASVKAPKTADEFNRKVEHLQVESPLAAPDSLSVPAAIGEPGELPLPKESKEEHGEHAAWRELNSFIKGRLAVVNNKIGTSYEKLDKYMRLGCISPRCVYLEVQKRLKRNSLRLHCAVMQLMLYDYCNVRHLGTSVNTKEPMACVPCN